MKKLSILPLLVLVMLVTSCDKEEENQKLTLGNLELSEAKPVAGDSLKIWYQPETAGDSVELESFFTYTVNTNSYPQDLDLVKDGERYTGSLQIPDSAQGLIFNFKNGEEYDSNKEEGYSVNLYDSSGNTVPGSASSIAWYKLTRGTPYGIKTSPDSTLAVLKKELQNTPELEKDWLITELRIMNQKDPKNAAEHIDSKLSEYSQKGELTSEDYKTLITLYQIKQEQAKADSIQTLFVTKYPKSQLAQNIYIQKMQQAKTAEERLSILDSFNSKIGTSGGQKNFLYRTTASGYLAEGDTANFNKYMAMAGDDASKASALNNIAWDYAEKGENLDLAEQLSKKALEIVKTESSNKPDFYTAKQYKKSIASTMAMYSDTYGLILFKQGKIKEAIAAQEVAVSDRTNPDVYERYIQFLMADEQFEKAEKEASKLVKEGNATTKTKEYLEAAYNNTKHTTNFGTYLADLEETAHKNALAKLKKEMIDEEAPTFNLKNLKGEEIALADLKGKTVVLDFWATWCGPCKVSFPGMQKAVTKYADNENVEFLFIDTWESTSGDAREKGVTDFITENKYTFNVLMDTPKEEGSREYEVVSAYEVDGIPTKFVVGPDGKIKFKAVGFDGNTDGLVEELEMMIDLASGQ